MKTRLPILLCLAFQTQAVAQDAAPPRGTAAALALATQRLRDAPAKFRLYAMMNFIEQQTASQAMYEGQYRALRAPGLEAGKWLAAWLVKPPVEIEDGRNFRFGVMCALRDVVDGKVDDAVMKALREIATGRYEQPATKRLAAVALAQFGDSSEVDAMRKALQPRLESRNPGQRASGLLGMADLHYRCRKYADAAASYREFFKLAESARLQAPPSRRAMTGYNAACTFALAGAHDEAFETLAAALRDGASTAGPITRRMLDTDMDLRSLRSQPRFAELVAKYFK